MKPASFRLLAPRTADEAAGFLAEHGAEAKVLAGGQSLVALMNLRLVSPTHLVDVTRIAALGQVAVDEGGVTVGAAVRQADVEDDIRVGVAVPLLADALPHIAHREIRNAGTVCGSIAHADPAAELPAIALATEATIVARSVRGERAIPAAEFFTGFLTTALEPDELVVSVRFPAAAAWTGTAFLEVAPRHGDYALAGVAAAVTMANGAVGEARIAFVGVDATPVRGIAGERLLAGEEPAAEALVEAGYAAAADLEPVTDVHATAAFRRHLAGVLARRALERAVERACGDQSAHSEGRSA